VSLCLVNAALTEANLHIRQIEDVQEQCRHDESDRNAGIDVGKHQHSGNTLA